MQDQKGGNDKKKLGNTAIDKYSVFPGILWNLKVTAMLTRAHHKSLS
jgi:hypothetical protein